MARTAIKTEPKKTVPVDISLERDLAAALGISPKQAKLLIALRSKPGDWLKRVELEAILGARVHGQDVDLLRDLAARGLVEIADGVRGSVMRVNIFRAVQS